MAEVLDFITEVTNNEGIDTSGGLRFFEGFRWRFIVTDLQLRATTWANDLWRERNVLFQLNQPSVITAAVRPDDFRVNGTFDDFYKRIAQSNRIVWAWRRDGVTSPPWHLREAGIVMSIDDQADADVPLSRLTAYTPWKLLEGRPAMDASGNLPGPNGFQPLGATGDQVVLEFLKNTIVNEGGVFIDAGPSHGGTSAWAGTIETTDPIAMTINAGMSVADVWNSLISSNNCDIVLTPIWDPTRFVIIDGVPNYFTHELSVYRLAGEYRPNARFSWDRLNRSTSTIERMHEATPGSFVDKVQFFAGQGGFPVPSTGPLVNAAAVAAFGSYWATQFFPQDSNAILDGALTLALAKQALEIAKQGSRTVTITTVPELAPVPLTGYRTADFVPVFATDRLRAPMNGFQRVQTIPVAIDDDGIETVAGLILSPDWRGSGDDFPTGPPAEGSVAVVSLGPTDARYRPRATTTILGGPH